MGALLAPMVEHSATVIPQERVWVLAPTTWG